MPLITPTASSKELDISDHSSGAWSACSMDDVTVVEKKPDNEDVDDLEDDLLKKDTTRVNLSKLVVYAVIGMAAIVVGACTYYFMEKEEVNFYLDEVRLAELP